MRVYIVFIQLEIYDMFLLIIPDIKLFFSNTSDCGF